MQVWSECDVNRSLLDVDVGDMHCALKGVWSGDSNDCGCSDYRCCTAVVCGLWCPDVVVDTHAGGGDWRHRGGDYGTGDESCGG